MVDYFECFLGILGFTLGLPKEWNCVGYSEIFQPSIELIQKYYPHWKNYGNIKYIEPETLPDFDLLTGGFPCPDFSIANTKRLGLAGKRGSLFYYMHRIIEVKKPKCFMLENVRGILNHNNGETFAIILNELRKIGYNVRHVLLDARFFGLAQQRKRVFIVGSLRGLPPPQIQYIGKRYKRDDTQSEKIQYAKTITTTSSGKQTLKADTYIAYTLGTENRGTGQLWNETYIARSDSIGKRKAPGFSRKLDKIRGHLIGNAVPPVMVSEVVKSILPILSK